MNWGYGPATAICPAGHRGRRPGPRRHEQGRMGRIDRQHRGAAAAPLTKQAWKDAIDIHMAELPAAWTPRSPTAPSSATVRRRRSTSRRTRSRSYPDAPVVPLHEPAAGGPHRRQPRHLPPVVPEVSRGDDGGQWPQRPARVPDRERQHQRHAGEVPRGARGRAGDVRDALPGDAARQRRRLLPVPPHRAEPCAGADPGREPPADDDDERVVRPRDGRSRHELHGDRLGHGHRRQDPRPAGARTVTWPAGGAFSPQTCTPGRERVHPLVHGRVHAAGRGNPAGHGHVPRRLEPQRRDGHRAAQCRQAHQPDGRHLRRRVRGHRCRHDLHRHGDRHLARTRREPSDGRRHLDRRRRAAPSPRRRAR